MLPPNPQTGTQPMSETSDTKDRITSTGNDLWFDEEMLCRAALDEFHELELDIDGDVLAKLNAALAPPAERPIEPHNEYPDPEQEWQRFWAEIVAPDGEINVEQVKKELADYSFLMAQASEVYCYFANLSKTNYSAQTIIDAYEDRSEKAIDDAVEEARKEWEAAAPPACGVLLTMDFVPDGEGGFDLELGEKTVSAQQGESVVVRREVLKDLLSVTKVHRKMFDQTKPFFADPAIAEAEAALQTEGSDG